MSLLQALHLPARPPAPGQPQTSATPVTLAIAKPDDPFEPNSQHKLGVVAFMADGKPQNYTSKAVWSSSNDALVKMSAGGIAKVGHGTGIAKITAATPAGKPRASIDVRVQAKLKDIVITPKNPLVEVGKTEVMTATAIYEDGSTEVVTPRVDWDADKDTLVEFPSRGAMLAKAAGTAKIVATDPRTKTQGFTTATIVDVGKGPKLVDIAIEPMDPEIRNGGDVQFRAYGIFADKSRHEVTRQVKWAATHAEILEIDEKSGLARPKLLSGTSRVSAVVPDTTIGKSTAVDVEFPGIVRIEVTPKEIEVRQGEAAPLTVTATLKGGAQMRVNPFVRFTLADEKVAVVDPDGAAVNGTFPGKTQIEAFEPNSEQPSTFLVTVLPAKLMDIVVLPFGVVIPIGESSEFGASGRTDNLRLVELDRPIWSTSDRKILHVTQQGVVTARKRGEGLVIVKDRHSDVVGSIGVVAGA